jgi:hypothetical protein
MGEGMAYGAVRLTLYALIGAIESDLRHTIASNLLVERSPKELLPQAIYQRSHERMERDAGFGSDSDAKIIDYLDFAECIEVLSTNRNSLSGPIAKAARACSAPIESGGFS